MPRGPPLMTGMQTDSVCTDIQIPLDGLERHRGTWANLSIDLAGLTAMCFRADAFRTLDYIAINPTCRLRKIFTMKGALNDEALEETAEGTGQHRRVAAALSGRTLECEERKSLMSFLLAWFTRFRWMCWTKGAGSLM